MRAVLTGQQPDRVPFAPCIYIDYAGHCMGHQFEEALADPRLGIQWMLEANRLVRSDVVRVLPTPSHAWFLQKDHLDGIEGIDPSSGMSVARTREAIGETLCLIGGVSCLTLLGGTPEQVRDEARACIRDGGPRYVLGSACAVPRFTPVENMRAFASAVLEVTS